MADAAGAVDLFNQSYLYSQIFWTAISFGILMLVLVWKVVPQLTRVLDERIQQVEADMKQAEEAHRQAEDMRREYEAQLTAAKQEAAEIVNIARQQAKAMVDEKMAEVDAELNRKRDDARQSIEASREKAMKSLQADVASMVASAAQHLLGDTVDGKKAEKYTDESLKRFLN